MKGLKSPLQVIRMLGALALGATMPAIAAATVLPLEVNFPVGSSATAQLLTTAPACEMRLSLHGLELEGEVRFQLNQAPPVTIGNADVKILGPGQSRYFPIGTSDISYYDLSVPVAAPAGRVDVRFSLDRISERLSGFRVVKLDLLGCNGASVLAPGQMRQDDPAQWSAPPAHASAADVAEGQRLFTQQPLLDSPFNRQREQMHCADCHASDGGDLRYFNYSNATIKARSMFHGMDSGQGEQIAAYIRSLDGYASLHGRPWNPPYQPGPGLDQRGAREWAAGAGIDAVLQDQRQMLPYLFPQGIGVSALLNPDNPHADPSRLVFGTLNMRELPTDLPSPDWNHWLPFVSLRDAVGGDVAFENSALVRTRAALDKAAASDDLHSYYGLSSGAEWEFAAASLPGLALSPAWTAMQTKQRIAAAEYSTNLWKVVKTWQLQQKYHLDDKIAGLEQESGPFLQRRLAHLRFEKRGWPTSLVFTTSPKFIDRDMGENIVTGNPRGEQYLRDAWYWQQMILNPGQGMGCGNNPVDWGYIPGAILQTGAPAVTGQDQFLRMVAVEIKSMQERDNGVAYGDKAECGWNPFRNPQIFNALLEDWQRDLRAGGRLTRPQYEALLNALLQAWLIKNKTYSYEEWHAATATDKTLGVGARADDEPRPDQNNFLPHMRLALRSMTCIDALRATQRNIIVWLGGDSGSGGGLWPAIDWYQVANSHPAWTGCEHSRISAVAPATASAGSD